MKIEINKVVITIGKNEIALTLQEARQLRDEMNRLFDERVKVERVEVWPYRFPYTGTQYPVPPQVTYADKTNCYTVTIGDALAKRGMVQE